MELIDPTLLQNIIDSLHLTLDWLDATTTELSFNARISGILQGLDLPEDASISFSKSLPIVWKDSIVIGHAKMNAIYTSQADEERVDNVLVTLTSDHIITSNFFRSLFKEKSISVELHVEEVTVHAGHNDYPNIGVSFRKSITFIGFDDLKDQILMDNFRITGTHEKGNGARAQADVTIKSPSNVSILVEEMPVELYYDTAKTGWFTLKSLKLDHSLAGTNFRENVPIKIQPKNHGDEKCKNFTSRYITTGEMLELHLSLTKTLIKLASSTISIPFFKVATTIIGIDKRIAMGMTGYLSLLRALLRKTCEFTFDIENPIDTEITITCLKGEATMKKGAKTLHLAKCHRKMEMFVPANEIMTSHRIPDGKIQLSLPRLIPFIWKKQIKLDVDVCANVSIGQYNLPEIAFKLTDIKADLKWRLY